MVWAIADPKDSPPMLISVNDLLPLALLLLALLGLAKVAYGGAIE